MRAYPLLALLLASGPAAAAVPTGCQEDYSSCKEDCAIEYGGRGRAVSKLTSCIAECQETLDHCANRHSSLKDLPPGVANDDARPARKSEPAKKKSKKDQEEDPFGDDGPASRRSGKDDPYGDVPPSDAKGGTEKRESYRASESPREREEVPPAPETAPPPRGAPGSRATSSRANAEEMVTGSASEGSKRRGYRASDAEPEPEKSLGLEGLEPLDAKPEPAPVAKSGAKSAPVKSAPEKPAASASPAVEKKDPLLDEEPAVIAAPPPSRKPATTTKAQPKPTPAPAPKKDISDWDPNGD